MRKTIGSTIGFGLGVLLGATVATLYNSYDSAQLSRTIFQEPPSCDAREETLHWVNQIGGFTYSEDGSDIVIGKLLGRGSLVEIVSENSNDSFVKIKVLTQVHVPSLYDQDWELVEEGAVVNASIYGLDSGTHCQYEQVLTKMREYAEDLQRRKGGAASSSTEAPEEGVQLSDIVFIPTGEQKAVVLEYWQNLEGAQGDRATQFMRGIEQLSAQVEFNLTQIETQSLEKILYLLSFIESGRAFIGEFLPLYFSGEMRILSIDALEARHFKKHTVAGAIAFYFEGQLFVDYHDCLLKLLPTFIHEGTHAIDLHNSDHQRILSEYLGAVEQYQAVLVEYHVYNLLHSSSEESTDEFKTILDRLQNVATARFSLEPKRDVITIEAEFRAYGAQERAIEDFNAIIPNYVKNIQTFVRVKEWVAHPIDEVMFRRIMEEAYGVSRNIINTYLQGHSWRTVSTSRSQR